MDTKGVGEAVENVMLPVTLFIVRVFGGISMKGRTVLYNQDNGTLTAMGYQDEILDPPIIKPNAGAVSSRFFLVHNYDCLHVARVCR